MNTHSPGLSDLQFADVSNSYVPVLGLREAASTAGLSSCVLAGFVNTLPAHRVLALNSHHLGLADVQFAGSPDPHVPELGQKEAASAFGLSFVSAGFVATLPHTPALFLAEMTLAEEVENDVQTL